MHISEFKGKKVLVVGLGKTGMALARLMAGGGALVTINDIHPEERNGLCFRGVKRGFLSVRVWGA